MRVGAGISSGHDPLSAGVAAARLAAEQLGGEPADLALVFASGAHLAAPEATLEGVGSVLEPAALVGCGAGGVLGGGRELETGTAVAVWAGSFGGEGSATPFHATLTDDGVEQTIEGLPDPEDSRPYFAALRELAALHGLRELSMGTSQDYVVAAQEGATIVRLGTSLYA